MTEEEITRVLAQKAQPMRQPTWEEMHTVLPW